VNLIIIEAAELDPSGHLTLSDGRASHLLDVLGATPGQCVRVGLLDGPVGTAMVTGAGGGVVGLQCSFSSDTPVVPPMDLLLALPRPKVMRRLWAQLAALGVGRIILTNAERVERCYFDSHVLDPACYRPLLVEGLQQARDTRLPRVSVHKRFRVLIEDELDEICAGSVRLMAQPGAGEPPAAAVRRPATRVLLAVGPEGGWSEFEQRLMQAHGFAAFGAGSRTLRTDTACIALMAVIQNALRARACHDVRSEAEPL
jgi:RsmE family RNA methyltransferase